MSSWEEDPFLSPGSQILSQDFPSILDTSSQKSQRSQDFQSFPNNNTKNQTNNISDHEGSSDFSNAPFGQPLSPWPLGELGLSQMGNDMSDFTYPGSYVSLQTSSFTDQVNNSTNIARRDCLYGTPYPPGSLESDSRLQGVTTPDIDIQHSNGEDIEITIQGGGTNGGFTTSSRGIDTSPPKRPNSEQMISTPPPTFTPEPVVASTFQISSLPNQVPINIYHYMQEGLALWRFQLEPLEIQYDNMRKNLVVVGDDVLLEFPQDFKNPIFTLTNLMIEHLIVLPQNLYNMLADHFGDSLTFDSNFYSNKDTIMEDLEKLRKRDLPAFVHYQTFKYLAGKQTYIFYLVFQTISDVLSKNLAPNNNFLRFQQRNEEVFEEVFQLYKHRQSSKILNLFKKPFVERNKKRRKWIRELEEGEKDLNMKCQTKLNEIVDINSKMSETMENIQNKILKLNRKKTQKSLKFAKKRDEIFVEYVNNTSELRKIVSQCGITSCEQFISDRTIIPTKTIRLFKEKKLIPLQNKQAEKLYELDDKIRKYQDELDLHQNQHLEQLAKTKDKFNKKLQEFQQKYCDRCKNFLNHDKNRFLEKFFTRDIFLQCRESPILVDFLNGNFQVLQKMWEILRIEENLPRGESEQINSTTESQYIPQSRLPPPVNIIGVMQNQMRNFNNGFFLNHEQWLKSMDETNPVRRPCLEYYAFMISTNSLFRDRFYNPTLPLCGGKRFVEEIRAEMEELKEWGITLEPGSLYYRHWRTLVHYPNYTNVLLFGATKTHFKLLNYLSANNGAPSTSLGSGIPSIFNYMNKNKPLINRDPSHDFSNQHRGLICNDLSEAILVNDIVLSEISQEWFVSQSRGNNNFGGGEYNNNSNNANSWEVNVEFLKLPKNDRFILYDKYLRNFSLNVEDSALCAIIPKQTSSERTSKSVQSERDRSIALEYDNLTKQYSPIPNEHKLTWLSYQEDQENIEYVQLMELMEKIVAVYGRRNSKWEGKIKELCNQNKNNDLTKTIEETKVSIEELKKLTQEFNYQFKNRNRPKTRTLYVNWKLKYNLAIRQKLLRSILNKEALIEQLIDTTDWNDLLPCEEYIRWRKNTIMQNVVGSLVELDQIHLNDRIRYQADYNYSKFNSFMSYSWRNYYNLDTLNFFSHPQLRIDLGSFSEENVVDIIQKQFQTKLDKVVESLNKLMVTSQSILQYSSSAKIKFEFAKGSPYEIIDDGEGSDNNYLCSGGMKFSEKEVITLYCFSHENHCLKIDTDKQIDLGENIPPDSFNSKVILYSVTIQPKLVLCRKKANRYENFLQSSKFGINPNVDVFKDVIELCEYFENNAVDRHGGQIYENFIDFFQNACSWTLIDFLIINQTTYKHKESFWLKNKEFRDFELPSEEPENFKNKSNYKGLYGIPITEGGDFALSPLEVVDYSVGHCIGLAFALFVCMSEAPMGARFDKKQFTMTKGTFFDREKQKVADNQIPYQHDRRQQTHKMKYFNKDSKLCILDVDNYQPYAKFPIKSIKNYSNANRDASKFLGTDLFSLSADGWKPYTTPELSKYFNKSNVIVGGPKMFFQDAEDYEDEIETTSFTTKRDSRAQNYLQTSLFVYLNYYNGTFDCMRNSKHFQSRFLKKIKQEESLWRSTGCYDEMGVQNIETFESFSNNTSSNDPRKTNDLKTRFFEFFEAKKLSISNETFIQESLYIALKNMFKQWKRVKAQDVFSSTEKFSDSNAGDWYTKNIDDSFVGHAGFFAQLSGIKTSTPHFISFMISSLRLLFSTPMTNGAAFAVIARQPVVGNAEKFEIGVKNKFPSYIQKDLQAGLSYRVSYNPTNFSTKDEQKTDIASNLMLPTSLWTKPMVISVNSKIQKELNPTNLLVGGYRNTFDYKALGFNGILLSNKPVDEKIKKDSIKDYYITQVKIAREKITKIENEYLSIGYQRDNHSLLYPLNKYRVSNSVSAEMSSFFICRTQLNQIITTSKELKLFFEVMSQRQFDNDNVELNDNELKVALMEFLKLWVYSFYDIDGIFARYSLDTCYAHSGTHKTQCNLKWSTKFKQLNVVEQWKQSLVQSQIGDTPESIRPISELLSSKGSCFFNLYPNTKIEKIDDVNQLKKNFQEATDILPENSVMSILHSCPITIVESNPIGMWDYIFDRTATYPHYLQYDASNKREWLFGNGIFANKTYSALGITNDNTASHEKHWALSDSELIIDKITDEITRTRKSIVLNKNNTGTLQPNHIMCFYADVISVKKTSFIFTSQTDINDKKLVNMFGYPWGTTEDWKNSLFCFYKQFESEIHTYNLEVWTELQKNSTAPKSTSTFDALTSLNIVPSNRHSNSLIDISTKSKITEIFKKWMMFKMGCNIDGTQGNILFGLELKPKINSLEFELLTGKQISEEFIHRSKFISPLGISPVYKWKSEKIQSPSLYYVSNPNSQEPFAKDYSKKILEQPSKTPIDVLQTLMALSRIQLSKRAKELQKQEITSNFYLSLQEYNLVYKSTMLVKTLYERYCLKQTWCNVLETKYIQKGKVKYPNHRNIPQYIFEEGDGKKSEDYYLDPLIPITHTIHVLREHDKITGRFVDYELTLPYDTYFYPKNGGSGDYDGGDNDEVFTTDLATECTDDVLFALSKPGIDTNSKKTTQDTTTSSFPPAASKNTTETIIRDYKNQLEAMKEYFEKELEEENFTRAFKSFKYLQKVGDFSIQGLCFRPCGRDNIVKAQFTK